MELLSVWGDDGSGLRAVAVVVVEAIVPVVVVAVVSVPP